MLQCAYAAVGGPGIIMHMLCFLAALISTATGLAAVGILWAIPKYNSAGESLMKSVLLVPWGITGSTPLVLWGIIVRGHPFSNLLMTIACMQCMHAARC